MSKNNDNESSASITSESKKSTKIRGSDEKKSTIDSENSPDTSNKKVHWSEENEKILVEWCDIAQCYKWLNARSHAKFSYMHAWFTIPAIVLSTISGTASFAQTSLPLQYQTYSPMVIGGINIFIGILTTIQQYLKISELNESHRVSSIAWDKFARNIRIELAKIPKERMDAGPFIKICRLEFDRLMETSPMIPENITKEFNSKFKGRDAESIKNFKKLKKPDICDTITSVSEVRNKWYLKDKDEKESDDDDNIDLVEQMNSTNNILEMQHLIIKEKDEELKKKHKEEAEKAKKILEDLELLRKAEEEQRVRHESQKVVIHEYINSFEDLYSRKPVNHEIYDNVKDKVDSDVLNVFLDNYLHDNPV